MQIRILHSIDNELDFVFYPRLPPKSKIAFPLSWDAAPSFVTHPLVGYIQCEIWKLHYYDTSQLQYFIKFLISCKCLHLTKINHILRRSYNRKPLPFCFFCSLKTYLRRSKCLLLLQWCGPTRTGSQEQFPVPHSVNIALLRSGLWPNGELQVNGP